MALRRFDVPDWQMLLFKRLPEQQRAVALRTGFPELARAIQGFNEPGESNRFDARTALTIVSLINDQSVLETVCSSDKRESVAEVAARRLQSVALEAASQTASRAEHSLALKATDHTDAIVSSKFNSIERDKAFGFLRGTPNYSPAKVSAWYQSLKVQERAEICEEVGVKTCKELCGLFAADIANGRFSVSNTGDALDLIYEHWCGPTTKAVAKLMLSERVSWDGSPLQTALSRMAITPEALDVALAYRSPLLLAHLQSARLLTEVRRSDLGFFAGPLIDAAFAAGQVVGDYLWEDVARRARKVYADSVDVAVTLLRVAGPLTFVETLEHAGFTTDDLDVLADALGSHQWVCSPCDLLAHMSVFSTGDIAEAFAVKLLERSPGVLASRGLWLKGWLAGVFAERLAERFGTNETKWQVAWSVMDQFPGTFLEFLDTVDELTAQS